MPGKEHPAGALGGAQDMHTGADGCRSADIPGAACKWDAHLHFPCAYAPINFSSSSSKQASKQTSKQAISLSYGHQYRWSSKKERRALTANSLGCQIVQLLSKLAGLEQTVSLTSCRRPGHN